jgi:pimeloyl-ACP methyl ester carboxylesterase
MKQILTFSFSFLFLTITWAAQLKLSDHRTLSYEAYLADQKGPVFIFLPGIYRGYFSEEKVLVSLRERQIPYVTLHFAEQPASVALTTKEAPDFSNIKAQDLAEEVASLAQELKIDQPLPVTLSYSGIVTQHLDPKRFPHVIETSPMGKDTDGLPANVVSFYEMWRAWVRSFPYVGEAWLRQTKNIQMHEYWRPWAESYSDTYPVLKDPEYKERAIQGYIALTNASEDFDLRAQDFTKGPTRFFILGEKEEPTRKSIQNEAIAKYSAQKKSSGDVFVIPNAGHIVSEDQPEAYIEVLLKIRDGLEKP